MNKSEIEKARELFKKLQGIKEKKSLDEGRRFLEIQENLIQTRRLIEVRV